MAPKPPPTSGVMRWIASASPPLAAVKASLAPCAPWLEIHCTRRPPSQVAADARTSSGQGATRWFRKRPVTVTSQSAKNSSAGVFSGSPERRRVEHGVAAGGLVDQRLGRRATPRGRSTRGGTRTRRTPSRRRRWPAVASRRRRPRRVRRRGGPCRSRAACARRPGLNGDGIGSRPSDSAVWIASTPGISSAESMSIDSIVPWATVDRT